MTQSTRHRGRIVIIDDQPASLKMLMTVLSEQGYAVHPANDGALGLQFIKHAPPDLVLLDIRMPGVDGYEVCASLKQDPSTRGIPVIFLSSMDEALDKVKAFRSGAVDYIAKPFEPAEVLARIDTHLSLRRLQENLESVVRDRTAELVGANAALEKALAEIRGLKDQLYKENLALRDEIDRTSMFEEIVGSSDALRHVLGLVAKVAPTESTVLITGETGTGKELIARAIHKRSHRCGRAFVSVNCAAVPSSLIASELFGHEKGAFTGALQRRLGRFELAQSGTIFLDEVGELPLETQVALLRVLQERSFERVGGDRPVAVDVRVIAATNRDLSAAVAGGTFRQDLFYRLNVFPIHVPSLRERADDIAMLAEYLIARQASKAGKKIRHIEKRTLELLRASRWPGNVRELQNVIERAVILCEGDTLSVDASWLAAESAPIPTAGQMFADTLATQERTMIEAALTETRGRVAGPSGAAAKLGINSSTLEAKIRALNIDKHRFKTTYTQKS
jgi:DNA-binding NtrC family response regulator